MKPYLLLVILIPFYSCVEPDKLSIPLLIENNSDIDSIVTASIYLNGKLISKTDIKREEQQTSSLFIRSENQHHNQDSVYKFSVAINNDTTHCKLTERQIHNLGFLHVNYVKTVFKKGYVIYDKILEKDSVVHYEFYCEAISNKGKTIR